jgi:Protein of unknown function (DUF2380)
VTALGSRAGARMGRGAGAILALWLGVGLGVGLVWAPPLHAETAVAILDFELNDLTLLPQTPEELARTASIRPQLEEALGKRDGIRLVSIDKGAATRANAGFGYLFDHHEAAARLGQEHGADWILVGRLHKPSFLFAYIMAHLVDARGGTLAANYVVEVKGPPEQVTAKGVERLAEKIEQTLSP